MKEIEHYYDTRIRHSQIYKKYGWPSTELSEINEECKFATCNLRRWLKVGWRHPLPVVTTQTLEEYIKLFDK